MMTVVLNRGPVICTQMIIIVNAIIELREELGNQRRLRGDLDLKL